MRLRFAIERLDKLDDTTMDKLWWLKLRNGAFKQNLQQAYGGRKKPTEPMFFAVMAYAGKEIVGWLCMRVVLYRYRGIKAKPVASVGVFVSPSFRKQGIGIAIVKHTIKNMAHFPFPVQALSAMPHSPAGHRCFQAAGFEWWGGGIRRYKLNRAQHE